MLSADYLLDLVLTVVAGHPAALIVSAALLCLSSTFSGCETALFSLTAPELNRIRNSAGRIDRAVASLHGDLGKLMPTILFCNMAVNVLLYALSAVIGASLAATHGAAIAFLYGLANLGMVIFFGEVFPKQLAIASHLTVARCTALQVWLCHRVLAAPMSLFNAVIRVGERVVEVSRRDHAELREEEFRLLMELSKSDGVISADEYELIDGIVDLPEVKIRDIMTPRVDAVMVKPDNTLDDAFTLARLCGHIKFPVFDPNRDEMVGWIDMREILVRPGKGNVEGHIKRFRFFSEHDRADQVLGRIAAGGNALMAVVDERGQTVGIFTMQDIMDEVLGHFGDYGNAPPESIRERDGEYHLAGGVSVREWRELFRVTAALPQSATVGGLVTALLGRPARSGEKVRLENVEMTVVSVWRNRVTEVKVSLLPEVVGGEGG